MGSRTALTFQFLIACTAAASTGPSNIPQPCTHAYSAPERFTPSKRMVCPLPLTNLLPTTRIDNPEVGGGLDGGGAGGGEGCGAGGGEGCGAGGGEGCGAIAGAVDSVNVNPIELFEPTWTMTGPVTAPGGT